MTIHGNKQPSGGARPASAITSWIMFSHEFCRVDQDLVERSPELADAFSVIPLRESASGKLLPNL